jgi:hypothetical protein
VLKKSNHTGYILVLTLALAAVILGLILMQRYQGSVTTAIQNQTSARLRAEWELSEPRTMIGRIGRNSTNGPVVPDSLSDKGDFSTDAFKVHYTNSDTEYAQHLFDTPGKGTDFLEPTDETVTYYPKSHKVSQSYRSSQQRGFPYLCFAPNGSVSITEAWAWPNQTEPKVKLPLEGRSGFPVWLGASDLVEVDNALPYGSQVHSPAGGTHEVSATGGWTHFPDYWPYAGYSANLMADIRSVQKELRSNGFNKTGLITGELEVSMILDLLKGKFNRIPNFLSYQQATVWPFFVIPQVKGEGDVIFITLHTPLMPDGSDDISSHGSDPPPAPSVEKIKHDQSWVTFLNYVLGHSPGQPTPPPPDDLAKVLPAMSPKGYPTLKVMQEACKILGYNMRWSKGQYLTAGPNDTQVRLTDQSGGPSPIPKTAEGVVYYGWSALLNELVAKRAAAYKQLQPALTAEYQDETERSGLEQNVRDLQDHRHPNVTEIKEDKKKISALDKKIATRRKNVINPQEEQLFGLDSIIYGDGQQPPANPLEYPQPQAGSLASQVSKMHSLRDEYAQKVKDESSSVNPSDLSPPGSEEGPDRAEELTLEHDGRIDPLRGFKSFSYHTLMNELFDALKGIVKDAMDTFPFLTIRVHILFIHFTIKIPEVWKIPSWLEHLGAEMVHDLEHLVIQPKTLFHLGQGPPSPMTDGTKFRVGSFTVPRGRSFRLAENIHGQVVDMTVSGDLWVQKGGCMVVDGNLVVQSAPPDVTPKTKFAKVSPPAGRIILEEGASLVVEGDLVANKVVVTGPVDKNHVMTSAIFCTGNVTIYEGTQAGMLIEDILLWAGHKGETFTRMAQGFQVMFQDVAPNLAKVTVPVKDKKGRQLLNGPFYVRDAYFGRYPVVFGYVIPFGPPFPTFETDKQNFENYIFRVLSVFFTTHLNLTLGENLYTHTDWWIFGEGVTPVIPKLNPDVVLPELKSGWSALYSGLSDLVNPSTYSRVGKLAEHAMDNQLKNFMTHTFPELVVGLVLSAYDMGAMAGPVDKIESWLDKVVPSFGPSLHLGSGLSGTLENSIAQPFLSEFESVTGHGNVEAWLWANAMLPFSPGVFIYSGETLNLGQNKPMHTAAGCFVAREDVNINCPYAVGTAVSVRGSISAHTFMYNPWFSEVFPYQPPSASGGGDSIEAIASYWKYAAGKNGWLYGSRQSYTPPDIQLPKRPVYFQAAGGWGHYE